jgi:DNA (cytosine-5)-methyltransferase 1
MASDAPVLLDLFCGAGGAAMGYHRAGFRVVGVDLRPQPHYPFEFHQADALTFPLDGFDVIHASPPCQGYSRARFIQGREHPQLLRVLRRRLNASQQPWIMENVSGAPMSSYLQLCGTRFGLRVYRHRQFESSHLLLSPGACQHPMKLLPGYLCVYGSGARETQTGNKGNHYRRATVAQARAAMGIDWMTLAELSQSIPPAYTEWIGRQLLTALAAGQVA